jgi:hypothetical protein
MGRLLLHRTAEKPKCPVVFDGAQSGKECAEVINKVEVGRITSISVKSTRLAFSSNYSKKVSEVKVKAIPLTGREGP